MTITVHLGPGETIGQALIRAALTAPPKEKEHEVITIPTGIRIFGSELRQTCVVERRTTGIPFLDYNGDQP